MASHKVEGTLQKFSHLNFTAISNKSEGKNPKKGRGMRNEFGRLNDEKA
jgi:hypothetical protein